ncbi:nitrite reductase small subunit NirD [Saccharothrix sp. ST-888]|uniref:nitrite reductase small subunit NirD n=1 Tax=Saccharothrix sp. ST-888 TaxID=1427391 RepID=UPI0009E44356|nr:nitrite reductase small subunit NirD [Saccharothrix sp. ST-888]
MTTTATATTATTATATDRVELRTGTDWTPVCDWAALVPGRGVAVLLPDGRQAAVFRDHLGRVHAVANRDPFTGAYVLSRGLLGSTPDGRVYVASPLLKQRFDLLTGACLDDDTVRIPVHSARIGSAQPPAAARQHHPAGPAHRGRNGAARGRV